MKLGEIGLGSASVNGNQIEFGLSNQCNAGIGDYTWSLNADSLLFDGIADPCPGRRVVLDGQTYTKSH